MEWTIFAQNMKLGLPYTHKNKMTDEMFIC